MAVHEAVDPTQAEQETVTTWFCHAQNKGKHCEFMPKY